MSTAALAAGVAGGCAVAAAWELTGVLASGAWARPWGRLTAPLRAARERGTEPLARERRRLAVTAAAALLAGGWLALGPVEGVALALGGPWATGRIVAARRRRWRAELADGAAPAARALADALAGGHSVSGALRETAAGGSVPGTAGRELAAVAAAIAAGEPAQTALERLRARACSPEWDAIVAGVALQSRSGGDLAALLRATAATLEEAGRAEADARTLTAQARFTARVVVALPLGALVLVQTRRPGIGCGDGRPPSRNADVRGGAGALRRLRAGDRADRAQLHMSFAAVCAGLAAALAVAAAADLLAALPRGRGHGGTLARSAAAIGRRLGLVREPEDLSARIAAAGLPPRTTPADVMAVKVGSAVLALAAALAPALMAGPGTGLLIAAGAVGAGFAAPDVWLARRARERARAAGAELPGALDLLAVALSAGLPPARALGEVGARTSGVFAAEARRAAALIGLGERRATAVAAVAERLPLPEIAALVAALERSERHGTPAASAVRALAVQARARRACELREHAARAAPKIQLVVALGLVPGVMLLVGAAVAATLA